MKNISNSLVHRFNNQFTTLVTALDAIGANLENSEYLKEIYGEIVSKKDEFQETLIEIRKILEERERI
ncbi:MAG: hypothetical protein H6621_00345 [Halobacteriovoraceae bacterium]|nr:hypothetical protein [Halobacteriovoraceae bacterium]MCB9093488.1 hypothetical protein [Halobacteriovoraceae bacterium]